MEIRDEILARMYVMLTLFGLIPIAIGVQVARVGLVDTDQLEAAGDRQVRAVAPIPALRGPIVDRLGRTLVVNTARYDIAVDPTIPGFEEVAEQLYANLGAITGRSANRYRTRVRGRSSRSYALLERGLTTAEVSRLYRSAPGLVVDARNSRTYNHGVLASHVLGHVDADLRGLAGIESRYDARLTGTAGHSPMRRDRGGRIRPAADGSVVLPDHGSTVVLTLDVVLQTAIEEALQRGVDRAGAKWGTAIAMDPNTGAILAMANVPTYDPNRPGAVGSPERRNHAVVDGVEPGSTFKLITAVAALQSDVIRMSDTVDTGPGWAVLHGRTLRDTHAYGRIPFSEVISVSSNIGAARVAERLERRQFFETARAFGFGMPTGIDLPGEVSGRLKRVSDWSRPTLSAMSRGYEIQATPLQLIAAYSAFANGGVLMKPYVVDGVRDLTGREIWRATPDSIRRVMSRDVAERLLPAFEEVVISGTAKKAAIPGVRVAGKTGTAWKVIDGAYSARHSRATFVGFFPAEDPQVTILVMMDEPRLSIYGGEVAAPVFAEAGRRWLPSMVEKQDEVVVDSVRIPEVENLPASTAEKRLLAAGLEPGGRYEPEAIVGLRTAASGSVAPVGGRVRLAPRASTAPTTMPDLRGWSVRDAAFWLSDREIRYSIAGSGTVTSHTPRPGAPITSVANLTAGSTDR